MTTGANIRELFYQKAQLYELADHAYIEKTMNQLGNIPINYREALRKKLVIFMKTKNVHKLQIQFNRIAGFVNDAQQSVHYSLRTSSDNED